MLLSEGSSYSKGYVCPKRGRGSYLSRVLNGSFTVKFGDVMSSAQMVICNMFKPDFSWIYYVEITFNLSFRLFFKLKDVARPVFQDFNYLPGALVFFDILMIENDADPTLLSFL